MTGELAHALSSLVHVVAFLLFGFGLWAAVRFWE
jgi:hypothetical protein